MTLRILALSGCCLFLPAPVLMAQDVPALGIVPRPTSLQRGAGAFELSDPVRIVRGSRGERIAEISTFLAGVIRERSGFEVRVTDEGTRGVIVLDTTWVHEDPEAYALSVSADGIRISGSGAEGLLWGVQTLRQLLPPSFEQTDARRRPEAWTIPAVHIVDAPAYGWRGSLMDVSRHFFPVEFVKRYVDLLSRYKMNVLHWHLTDDQGWRLQIEAYPELTSVAAWRTEPDGTRYGGFYTHDEVREIIEYARIRGVTVVPEIEMPGHSSAALVAYPELACGEAPAAVPVTWGVFAEIYCVGNGEVLPFLENVLDEVAALFPSNYVHIGGDEVPTDRWESCEACQALMRREGLADEAALQAWFLRRIGDHLAGLGKTMIGWDEILGGGGVPGSVVQIWRDTAGTRAAIEQGHDVIVSPTSHAYLDYSAAGLPLSQVYSFEPAPPNLTPDQRARVLGGEANLWSEYITTGNFDLMAFPRILAMAEALWTQGDRDFESFHARLRGSQYERLAAMGVRVGPEDSDVIQISVRADPSTGEPRVTVESAVDDLNVRYATDGSAPTVASPLLSDSTVFAAGDSVTLGVFVEGERLAIERAFSVVDHLARGLKVDVEPGPDDRYPGPGPGGLIDGLLGSTNHHDGIWQGWWRRDLRATVDLGTPTEVRSIRIGFLRNPRAWILPPERVQVAVSTNGEDWDAVGPAVRNLRERIVANPGPEMDTAEDAAAARVDRVLALPGPRLVRFVRILARPAVLPATHPGAGGEAWIFADEVIVR